MQQTFAIIKPDAVHLNLIGPILTRAQNAGLTPTSLSLQTVDADAWRVFYREHAGRDFFDELIEFMADAPCVLAVLTGNEAIPTWRSIIGATDPKKAAPGTLRRMYGHGGPRNVAHGSDSELAAIREISWFRGLAYRV